MNKKDFEKFSKRVKEEFKTYTYVESLELLVELQQKTIDKLVNEMGVENVK